MNKCPNCGTEYEGNFCPNGCNSAVLVSPVPAPKKKMKPWIIALIVIGAIAIVAAAVAGIFVLSGAGTPSPVDAKATFDEAEVLTDSEIAAMYTDPDAFSRKSVILTGKVFSDPEQGSDYIAFQMFQDIENYDRNTVITYPATDITVSSGDYVRVKGVVDGKFDGTNAFGGSITCVRVSAVEVEVLDYMEALSPTLSSAEIDQSEDQYGYTVTVQKVEFAENETRLYLKVDNNGSTKFSLYSFNAKIVQDGKQYEEQRNYDADYPEIQSDLLPGTSTEGIIAFPAMEPASFKIVIEAYSDDYEEDISDYTFDVAI